MREIDVKAGQTFAITEFLKPGVEEFCSILPSFLARGVLGIAERFPARAHWGMAINTRSISGYLRFALLAKARYSGRYRPAWRISQIGGIDWRSPCNTRTIGLITEQSRCVPFLYKIES